MCNYVTSHLLPKLPFPEPIGGYSVSLRPSKTQKSTARKENGEHTLSIPQMLTPISDSNYRHRRRQYLRIFHSSEDDPVNEVLLWLGNPPRCLQRPFLGRKKRNFWSTCHRSARRWVCPVTRTNAHVLPTWRQKLKDHFRFIGGAKMLFEQKK